MKSFEKALLKLLKRHGYTGTDNGLGYRVFTKDGCRDVDIYPFPGKTTCERFTRQINLDANQQKPPAENDWEATERRRGEAQALREAADAARVKDNRLGGLSKVLTEREVDKVARRTEQRENELRNLDHLIRERPLGAGRAR